VNVQGNAEDKGNCLAGFEEGVLRKMVTLKKTEVWLGKVSIILS